MKRRKVNKMAVIRSNGTKVSSTEAYRSLVQDHLSTLELFLRKQATERETYRKQRASIVENQNGFLPEVAEKQLTDLDSKTRQKWAAAYEEVCGLIESLVTGSQARYEEPLDLSDPSIIPALTIIQTVSTALPFEGLKRLIDSFTGNPAALKILNAAFEGRGMTAGVELVKQRLYDPAFVEVRLKEVAVISIGQGGSLNAFAGEVNRLMAIPEGMTFPLDNGESIDPQGVLISMRKAAGLLDTPGGLLG